MDKPKYHSTSNTAERKGFALLITLSVLAVLIALTGVLLSYFDTVRKDAAATKALVQADLYYMDIRKIIGDFKEKKVLYTTLYQMPVPLRSPDGRFDVQLQCRPRANGININWLGKEDDPKMRVHYDAARKLFENIVQDYDLEDAGRLEEMLLEEMQGKKSFIAKENNRLLQKNGIISSKQFRHILQQYQFETDDRKVALVPWEKYFVFGDSGELVDGNYLSAELIAILFDIDLESVKDEWVEGGMNLKDFVSNMGEEYNDKLYAQKFVEEAKCSVQYAYEDGRFAFTFIDSEGEVKDFEFNGKQ
ncbi:hypothetical protein YH65_00130 [Sulfurovum lithotrophicum]|uniref:Type II secretion system protein K n=1 Tax=Sulfurovum lithotrophicum TaxID=206403 RepID=A0A7U4LZD2_9BACT|nr:hypothetical protein [Sulfurovum lithotrophicum]AKF23993.1 hypothetical protein YH65_00130 [Sulfurovum lithotrophicum]